MPVTDAKAAYEDCFDILDRALTSPNGIRWSSETEGTAKYLIQRLNKARMISRKESKEIFPHDHPQYGTSAYDTLTVRAPVREDGKWWVYIKPRRIEGEIEELPGAAE